MKTLAKAVINMQHAKGLCTFLGIDINSSSTMNKKPEGVKGRYLHERGFVLPRWRKVEVSGEEGGSRDKSHVLHRDLL